MKQYNKPNEYCIRFDLRILAPEVSQFGHLSAFYLKKILLGEITRRAIGIKFFRSDEHISLLYSQY